MDVKEVPWDEIKARYMTGNTTYRQISKDYGVSLTAICNHAKKDGWQEALEQTKLKTALKMANRIGNRKVDRMVRAMDISDKLMDKLEKAIEQVQDEEGRIDTAELESLIRGFQKLMVSQGLKSEMDMAEQQARIDKLRKETAEDSGTEVVVTIEGGAEQWAN